MSEVEAKIDECIDELMSYRSFSSEVEVAIKRFEELKEQLKNITKENVNEILKGVEEGYQSTLAYSSYLPITVANLRFIKEWLEKKKASM